MKIIIFGATELGCLIATEFFEDHDVTIIDNEVNITKDFNKLDIGYVQGNATSIDTLKQADIRNADVFLSCTDSDELNIVACLAAKRVSGIKTICFVNKEEYKSTLENKESDYSCDMFIDYIIWSAELLTQEIFRIITVAQALDVENFADGRARLLEYKLNEKSVLLNQKIRDCAFPEHTIIVGITRDSELFIPTGETIFEQDDKVIFMGLAHQLDKLAETIFEQDDKVIFMGLAHQLDKLAGTFFHEKEFVKSVCIIGGGTIGLMLARNLEEIKIKAKVIEKNIQRCEVLAQELSNTLVINGDGTNLSLLDEEEISDCDVVVSVTNNDEKNLLCSLLAKQLGVKRVISRVSKNLNIPLFERVGIDVAVSPNNAALNEVKNDLYETNVDILATVEQGQGEVLEIIIPETFEDIKIKDLRMPAKAIVGTIKRRNRVIIPKGDTLVMKKDKLIIFTTNTNAPQIKEFFKGN